MPLISRRRRGEGDYRSFHRYRNHHELAARFVALPKPMELRRPTRDEFITVVNESINDEPVEVYIAQYKNRFYLVSTEMKTKLKYDVKLYRLAMCMNREEDYFIWPIRKVSQLMKSDTWAESAWSAYEAARSKWVRLIPISGEGRYDAQEREGTRQLPESVPDFKEGLASALQDTRIDSENHPVACHLMGRF